MGWGPNSFRNQSPRQGWNSGSGPGSLREVGRSLDGGQVRGLGTPPPRPPTGCSGRAPRPRAGVAGRVRGGPGGRRAWAGPGGGSGGGGQAASRAGLTSTRANRSSSSHGSGIGVLPGGSSSGTEGGSPGPPSVLSRLPIAAGASSGPQPSTSSPGPSAAPTWLLPQRPLPRPDSSAPQGAPRRPAGGRAGGRRRRSARRAEARLIHAGHAHRPAPPAAAN